MMERHSLIILLKPLGLGAFIRGWPEVKSHFIFLSEKPREKKPGLHERQSRDRNPLEHTQMGLPQFPHPFF
jgi:hypothetical protein